MSDKEIHTLCGEIVAASGILRNVGMSLPKDVHNHTKQTCREAQEAVRRFLRSLSYEEKRLHEDKIKLLQRELQMRNMEIMNAHEVLDEMDAPQSQHGAFVGPRLYWYSQGKRQSYKSKDNTEGYPPGALEQMLQKTKDATTPKKTNRLPIIQGDDE